MSKLKLLSPAGGMSALYAAVENGADEVYLGASSFSARGNAANFTDSEIAEAVHYAKPRGVKVFLALNTLIYQNEFDKVSKLVGVASDAGVDAIIVQDTGVARLIRETAPDMPIHASTQMTIHSTAGVDFARNMGFERVVLSRELPKERIREICSKSIIETEVFVHGALCMCYSGKCLMSSMIGGRSGNRGLCAQPCRQLYESEGKNGYLLSPMDLCLLNNIKELEEMGVTSVKIEGRMKSAEYVATVTRIYRKAIDKEEITDDDIRELTEIFCRGDRFTKGFYGGETGRKMINAAVSNDKTGREVSPGLLKKARKSFENGTRKSKIDVSFENGVLTMAQKEHTVTVHCEKDTVPPLSEDRIKAQLLKLGATPFYADSAAVSGEFPVRVGELNNLRRQATEKLIEKICAPKSYADNFDVNINGDYKADFDLCAVVREAGQAKAAIKEGINRIYADLSLLTDNELKGEAQIFAVLPEIIRDDQKQQIKKQAEQAAINGCMGFVCGSVEALCLAKEFNLPIIGGAGLNITNKVALDFYKGQGISSATLSPELTPYKIKELAKSGILPLEIMVYGRFPLMITENCIVKSTHGKCNCKTYLKDKTGAEFPVLKREGSCGNVIYNCVPLFLADKPALMEGPWIGQMCFTTESEKECAEIIRLYKTNEKYGKDYTRGYFNK